MTNDPGILKKIFWPVVIVAGVAGLLFIPVYRALPAGNSFVLLFLLPFCLWMSVIMFQNDRMCSILTEYLFIILAVLCLLLGYTLRSYQIFPSNSGTCVVLFGIPLLWVAISEVWRIVFVSVCHEPPCYNYRSGSWIGDRPRDGFFTTFPPDKVLSWADVLFGITQMLVGLVLTMALIIWSAEANW